MKLLGLLDRPWPIVAAACGGFLALIALEFAGNERWPTPMEVVLEVLELGLLVTVTAGVAVLALTVQRDRQQRHELLHDLAAARSDGQQWRAQAQVYVNGVAAAIGEEFKRWQLSEAEAAVAWFVLKGLSHKEIATLRGTSEATVRQQAHTAYEKAGLKGRAAFCAYFLEDLLPSADMSGHAAQGPSALQPAESAK